MSHRHDNYSARPSFSNYAPVGAGDLEQWLLKKAEGGEDLPDDEDKTVAVHDDGYDTPTRGDDDPDASWGNAPRKDAEGNHEAYHHHNHTYSKAVTQRTGAVERLLENYDASKATESKELSELFAHVGAGNFSTRSTLLQEKSKHGSAEVVERLKSLGLL